MTGKGPDRVGMAREKRAASRTSGLCVLGPGSSTGTARTTLEVGDSGDQLASSIEMRRGGEIFVGISGRKAETLMPCYLPSCDNEKNGMNRRAV